MQKTCFSIPDIIIVIIKVVPLIYKNVFIAVYNLPQLGTGNHGDLTQLKVSQLCDFRKNLS